MKRLHIAVVGLVFGQFFVALYKAHPGVRKVTLCDLNADLLHSVATQNGIESTRSSLDQVLADPDIDAVHLVTPIPLHEEQSIAVLEAGKHCACAVPMAISLDGIRHITEAQRRTGKTYMMMETMLYSSQLFYVRQLLASGAMGRLQFYRGMHYQEMAPAPHYWYGLPPMYYSTHALSPLVYLTGSRVEKVYGLGSGTMDPELQKNYGNPYPIETMLVTTASGLKGEVTRSLFETAHVYQEGFSVYGSRQSLEWGFSETDDPVLTVTGPEKDGKAFYRPVSSADPIRMPDYLHLLPPELLRGYDPADPIASLPWTAHQGSHPHLVHEFVSAVLENRRPAVDAVIAGNITATGICAHESALCGGREIAVPEF